MTEPNLRQQIYDVLNVHTPTDCKRWHCWGVEEIEKIIANQVREAKIDMLKTFMAYEEKQPGFIDWDFLDGHKDQAKKAIERIISDQVAKARIEELIGVRGWTEYEPDPKYSPAERFHIVPYTYLTKRIEELKRSKE